MKGELNREPVAVLLTKVASQWKLHVDQINRLAEYLRDEFALEQLSSLAPGLDKSLEDLRLANDYFEDASESPEIVIAMTGTTSSGKSTLANLLIGENILPKAVQEMSAGVVSVRHHDFEKQLIIDATQGATWTTGTWDNLTAAEIRSKLEAVMLSYRQQLNDEHGSIAHQLLSPRFTITWPTQIHRILKDVGLPVGARITILDLPGLKYVDDEINGGVLREYARKALCLVTYNAFETDPRKQNTLLHQVVDQVKALGGSPARMLFILNRIDAFRNERDPETSEQMFCDRITQQIRKSLLEALPEFSTVIEKISPIPLSSEPALMAVLAEKSEGKLQDSILESLEDEYKKLFPRQKMNELPRSAGDWNDSEKRWFVMEAKLQSRFNNFERNLCYHISEHLPELLLPDLVDGVYQPAKKVLTQLDALIEAYSLNEESQLADALEHLEVLYKRLESIKKNVFDLLAPLDEAIAGSKDIIDALRVVLPDIATKLDMSEGSQSLDALRSAIADTIQVPIQRFAYYLYRSMAGDTIEESSIEATGCREDLKKAVENLLLSPYGKVWETGGKFKSSEEEAVTSALNIFAKEAAACAEKLVSREYQFQSVRMEDTLNSLASAIQDKIELDAVEVYEELGFLGLSGIFRGKISMEPPSLSKVRFSVNPTKWKETKEYNDKITETVRKRVWWTLWIGKHKFTEVREVKREVSEEGIEIMPFSDLLEGFFGSADISDWEREISNWLRNSLSSFSNVLKSRLDEGVSQYKSAFVQRSDELQRDVAVRVTNVKRYSPDISILVQNLENSRKWRVSDGFPTKR